MDMGIFRISSAPVYNQMKDTLLLIRETTDCTMYICINKIIHRIHFYAIDSFGKPIKITTGNQHNSIVLNVIPESNNLHLPSYTVTLDHTNTLLLNYLQSDSVLKGDWNIAMKEIFTAGFYMYGWHLHDQPWEPALETLMPKRSSIIRFFIGDKKIIYGFGNKRIMLRYASSDTIQFSSYSQAGSISVDLNTNMTKPSDANLSLEMETFIRAVLQQTQELSSSHLNK